MTWLISLFLDRTNSYQLAMQSCSQVKLISWFLPVAGSQPMMVPSSMVSLGGLLAMQSVYAQSIPRSRITGATAPPTAPATSIGTQLKAGSIAFGRVARLLTPGTGAAGNVTTGLY